MDNLDYRSELMVPLGNDSLYQERETMILRMDQSPSIDNLRDYPDEVVNLLGKLLAEGVTARQDPRRNHFYDIEHPNGTFFIHVNPSSRRVILLAKWVP